MRRFLLIAPLIFLTGCIAKIDTTNPVFARFAQFHDQTNLSLANPYALEDYFTMHSEAADEIDCMCVSRHGTSWTDWITVEGRLCWGAKRARRRREA